MALNIKGKVVGLDESIQDIVNRVNRRGLSVKIRASDFTQPLGRITQKADEFSKSLEASNARVIAFGASAAIIGSVATAFSQVVIQAVKVEKILTDINVVLGTSLSNLEKFGRDLFDVARNTSQGLEVAAEAALEFSRQGLSMEETLRRTNDALILTRLTGIDAASAVSGLTAAVNGFADAGLTTTAIINKLAAVDVQFAVSADDLINALARSGAVAQDAGVSFDQLVGAVTSAQQITARGGAVIGNSFKTIFTRIQRSSTLDRLEELGVAVRDIRGNTLPALNILTQLSKTYDTLGAATKAAVAEQVGGVFQINVLKAALKDLNRENSLYAQATEISANATDQAQQKNAQLQQTISSLAKQTSLTVQELAANIGDLALAPGISNILDAINSAGQALNDLFGSDSESLGSDFAKGLVRGIGNVLTGPGLVVAFGIFGKLFFNALKFAKSSLKDILGIVTAKDKERKIQESIVMALGNNKQLALELNKYAGDKLRQEEIMLAVISDQTKFLERQAQLAASLAPGLVRAGVTPGLTLGKPKTASTGFVPKESSVSNMEAAVESGGAQKAGYKPGKIKKTKIEGVGDVVYNDAETVKKFDGFSQEAILPPQQSKAGRQYKSQFENQHGFDPYKFDGLVPNFIDPRTRSQKINDVLNDPANKGIKFKNKQAGKTINFQLNNSNERRFVEIFLKQKLGSGDLYIDRLRKVNGYSEDQLTRLRDLRSKYQSGHSVSLNGTPVYYGGYIPNFANEATIIPGTNILKLPQAKMQVETSLADYRGNKKTGLHTLEAPISSVAGHIKSQQKELLALQQSGVNVLSRDVFFSSYDNPQNRKDRKVSAVGETEDFAKAKKGRRAPTTKALGDRYDKAIHKKYTGALGYKMTHDQAKVDQIGKGLTPIESKYNKIEQANLIAKSIRLYSDKSISDFLRRRGLTKEGQSFQRENLSDSLNVLSQAGIDTESLSLKEQAKLVKQYNLYRGLIPNFAKVDYKKVRSALYKANTIDDFLKDTNLGKAQQAAHLFLENSKESDAFVRYLAFDSIKNDSKYTIDPKLNTPTKFFNQIKKQQTNPKEKQLITPFRKDLDKIAFQAGRSEHKKLKEKYKPLTTAHDYKNAYSKLKKNEYDSIDQYAKDVNIPKNYLNDSQLFSPGSGLYPGLKLHLNKNEIKDFRNRINKLNNLGSGKAKQFIKGNAFEKYIVEEAFKKSYSKDSKPFDLENIASQSSDETLRKLFDIQGPYTYGDTIWSQNDYGHGPAKILKKIMNQGLFNFSRFKQPKKRMRPVAMKGKSASNSVKTYQFNYGTKVADMIGMPDQRMGKTIDRHVVTENKNKLTSDSREGPSTYIKPELGEQIPDGSKIAFTYTRDYVNVGDQAASILERIKDGESEPNIREELQKLNFFEGLIPNFARIKWSIDKAKNQYSLQGTGDNLDSFAYYLSNVSEKYPNMVKPTAVAEFEKRSKQLSSKISKERDQAKKDNPIGFGREGAKHYSALRGVSDNPFRTISTQGLFIKELGKHVKQFNKFGIYGVDRIDKSDSFFEHEGLIPNFANLTLYRGQKRGTIDKPTIGKNMPSFAGVKTPEDAVKIIQDFVKSHVSGPLSGYRDMGEIDNTAPSGATSFSTSETVAKTFAGGGLGKPAKDNVLSKTVPEKNVFNKKKLLRILNKGADPKKGYYPKVEEFKKAMASGAIQKWAEQNGGIYLNVSGRRNDPSLLKHYKTEYGRKDYDFYDRPMNQIVPESDIGYNPNGTRQISPREAEVMQIFNRGLIPNFSVTQAMRSYQLKKSGKLQKDEFNATSTALTNFNAGNAMFTKTALSGPSGIKLTKRNFDQIRQFVNSKDFRQLDKLTQNKILVSLKSQSLSLGLGDVTRGYGQYSDPSFEGSIAAALGLIPNFSALQDAIGREKKAGVPASTIRVDQDDSLKSRLNPMGLAVTNTRDEPAGVKQGIQRAKEMGLDPKTHGAAGGFMPNFQGAGVKNIKFKQGVSKEVQDEYKKNAEALRNSTNAMEEQGEATTDLTGRLFGLTSITYLLEGAFSEVEGTTGQVLKTFVGVAQGASQAALTFQALQPISEGVSDKLTKWGSSLQGSSGAIGKAKGIFGTLTKSVGTAAKHLPIIGSVVAGLVPAFSALKENTTLFDSGLDTLNKSAQKTAKSIEAVGNAMEATTSVQETQKQITDLTNSSQANTYQGQMQLLSLNSRLVKNQDALQQSALSLAKELNLSGDELQTMTSGTAQGMEKLQEAMTKLTIRQSVTSSLKNMNPEDSIYGTEDFGTFDDISSRAMTSPFTSRRKSHEEFYNDMDRKDRINFKSGALGLSNTMNAAGVQRVDALSQMSKFQRMDTGDRENDLDLMESYAQEIEGANQPLAEFVLQSIAMGKSAEHIRYSISLLNPIYQKIADQGKKIAEENEIQASISREVNALKRSILNSIALEAVQANNNLKLLKDEQTYAIQRMSHQAKVTESLGFLSESSQVSKEIAIEQQKIDNEYLNKKTKANNDAVDAQNKLAAEIFAGSKKQTGNNFSMLNQDYESGGETVKFSEDPDKAFEGNRKKLQTQLIDAGMSDLASKLEGVRSAEEANAITLQYTKNLNDSSRKSKELAKLQEMNVISVEDLDSKLEAINQSKSESLRLADEEKKIAQANKEQLKKELLFNKGGASASRQKLEAFKAIKQELGGSTGIAKEINQSMKDSVDAILITKDMQFEINDAKRQQLASQTYLNSLVDAMTVTMEQELTTELESLAKARARLKAEDAQTPEGEKLRDLTKQTIEGRVSNESAGFSKKIRDRNTESFAKFKQDEFGKNFFENAADFNLVDLQETGRELAEQFRANKEAGVHSQKTLNDIAEEGRSFSQSLRDAQDRLKLGDFGDKARRSSLSGLVSSAGALKASQSNQLTPQEISSIDSETLGGRNPFEVFGPGSTTSDVNAESTLSDLTAEMNNAKDRFRAFSERGVFTQQAITEMGKESLSFKETLIKLRQRLESGDYGTKALEQIESNNISAEGESQAISRKREVITDPDSAFQGLTGFVAEAKVRIKNLNNSTDNLVEQFNANKEAGFYQAEATHNYVKTQTEGKEAQERFTEALKKGQFQLEALEGMKQAARDFEAEMIRATVELQNGEGFREGRRDVERKELGVQRDFQRAIGARDTYQEKQDAGEGDFGVKIAESELAAAKARKEMNIELGKEALFRDTITERIAENNVALERFGETLANTSFDAVENGLNDLVTNMGDSTKSMSDSLKSFAGGIAQSISDALRQRATKQLTSGIFEMFGMGDSSVEAKNKGGLIQGFASGGSVSSPSKVPAMLTSGEYVVRKKIVDRLGSKSLESINESGSLDDLYNKNNEDLFDISTEGAAPLPSVVQSGDRSMMERNLLNQRPMISEDKPSVASLSNEESEAIRMNALSDALNKFHGGIVGLFQGGLANLSKILTPVKMLNRGGMSDYEDWSGFGFNASAKAGIAMRQQNLKGELTARSSSKPASVESPEPNIYNRSLHEKAANIKSAASNIESMNSRAPVVKPEVGDPNAQYSHVPANKSTAASSFYDQTMSIGSDSPGNIQQSLMNTSSIPATRKSLEKQLESADFEVPGFDDGGDTSKKKNWLEKTYDAGKSALSSNGSDSAMTKISKGAGTLFGNILASREKDKGQNEDNSPQPPSKPQRLNTSSALDIDPTSSMMSARYNANDSYRKDYAQYLLDKYEYEVQKQNEHVMNNANQLQQIAGNITTAIAAHGLNKEFENIKKLRADKAESKAKALEDKVATDSKNFKKVEMKPKSERSYSDFGARRAKEANIDISPGASIAQGSPSSNHTTTYSKSAARLSQPAKNTTINNKYLYTGKASNNTETPHEIFMRTRQEKPLKMSAGGRVHGPGGIDKVGPIMLDKGEYVIKASSVQNVEKKYPGFFDRLNSMKMNQGGPVTNTPNVASNVSNANNTSNQSNNITVNVSMPGNNSSDGNSGSIDQQALAGKIKEAVTHVISQEQRVGGSLRGK